MHTTASQHWEEAWKVKSYWFNELIFSPLWEPQKVVTTHKTMQYNKPGEHSWHIHCANLKINFSGSHKILTYQIGIPVTEQGQNVCSCGRGLHFWESCIQNAGTYSSPQNLHTVKRFVSCNLWHHDVYNQHILRLTLHVREGMATSWWEALTININIL